MSSGVGVSECCLSGKIQQGTPTGSETQIGVFDYTSINTEAMANHDHQGELNTYVAEPSDAADFKVVVFLVDSTFFHTPTSNFTC